MKQLMGLDVKRAFLHSETKRAIFVKPPPEVCAPVGMIWKLKKTMYGTRDAPQVWRREVHKMLIARDFKNSKASPCFYYHEARDMNVITHVDDFLCCGDGKSLRWLRESLATEFDMTGDILGPGEDEKREIRYLKRTIWWKQEGLSYAASDEYVQKALRDWEMEGCKSVTTPGTKEEESKGSQANDPVSKEEAARYRSTACLLNYLALDRPDISFATKEVCRRLTEPDRTDIVRLKRIIRYLKGVPRVIWRFKWQAPVDELSLFSDSDWAGCRRTRRSTSGGVVMLGGHLIYHWSRTQATVALSTAEAELNASLKASCEGLFVKTVCQEMFRPIYIVLYGDSSASHGILQREGCGAVKHLAVRQLWLQEKVRDESVQIVKLPRARNFADALTHYWSSEADGHYANMGLIREKLGNP